MCCFADPFNPHYRSYLWHEQHNRQCYYIHSSCKCHYWTAWRTGRHQLQDSWKPFDSDWDTARQCGNRSHRARPICSWQHWSCLHPYSFPGEATTSCIICCSFGIPLTQYTCAVVCRFWTSFTLVTTQPLEVSSHMELLVCHPAWLLCTLRCCSLQRVCIYIPSMLQVTLMWPRSLHRQPRHAVAELSAWPLCLLYLLLALLLLQCLHCRCTCSNSEMQVPCNMEVCLKFCLFVYMLTKLWLKCLRCWPEDLTLCATSSKWVPTYL